MMGGLGSIKLIKFAELHLICNDVDRLNFSFYCKLMTHKTYD